MDAAEMVKQLKARRISILEIIPKLKHELEQIDVTVRDLEAMLGKGYVVDVPVPSGLAHVLTDTPRERPKETRIPLAQRRAALRDYLAARGPATRAQILADTGIPAGSLSALLAEQGIVSSRYGTWHLQGTRHLPEEDD